MPFVKGQVANPNGRPKNALMLTEQLRRYLLRKDPTKGKAYRELFVEKTYELAMAGNPQALREVWERMDGKVPQAIEGGGSSMTVNFVWGSTPQWANRETPNKVLSNTIELKADEIK